MCIWQHWSYLLELVCADKHHIWGVRFCKSTKVNVEVQHKSLAHHDAGRCESGNTEWSHSEVMDTHHIKNALTSRSIKWHWRSRSRLFIFNRRFCHVMTHNWSEFGKAVLIWSSYCVGEHHLKVHSSEKKIPNDLEGYDQGHSYSIRFFSLLQYTFSMNWVKKFDLFKSYWTEKVSEKDRCSWCQYRYGHRADG